MWGSRLPCHFKDPYERTHDTRCRILSRSASVSLMRSALPMISVCAACFQQATSSQIYAPRPPSRPDESSMTPLSVFASRVNVCLSDFLRHTTQVRCGTCLCRVMSLYTSHSSPFFEPLRRDGARPSKGSSHISCRERCRGFFFFLARVRSTIS